VASRFRLKNDPDDVREATLGSRFVRWLVATRSSPKRSPSWTCSSLAWLGKAPRSWSFCGVSPIQAYSDKVVRHRLDLM
jgi:hypothetical protein